MKRKTQIVLFLIIICSVISTITNAQVHVSAVPEELKNNETRRIRVPVMIDVSHTGEKLGSYTAVIIWNPKVLKLINYYSTEIMGFNNPFINSNKKEKGIIEFNAVNVYGGEGNVNIMNFIFEVIDESYSDQPYEIKFSAMAAAQTFNDLLPCITELKYSTKENFINEKIEDKID